MTDYSRLCIYQDYMHGMWNDSDWIYCNVDNIHILFCLIRIIVLQQQLNNDSNNNIQLVTMRIDRYVPLYKRLNFIR